MARGALLAALPLAAMAARNNNGLNRVPLMGWNTWCTAGKCELDVCNEAEVKGAAQALLDTGMYDVGFRHVALDDCWADPQRDANGNLQPDPSRFPLGIAELASWLHARNLTFGIYTSLGYHTCSMAGHKTQLPGSFGYYDADAATFAEWGVDVVKGDWCDPQKLDMQNVTTSFAGSLNKTGRDMWFNFHCRGTWDAWCAAVGDSSRVWTDHHDSWYSDDPGHQVGTIEVIEGLAAVGVHAGLQPDGQTIWWPDWDFLMTGGAGCANSTTGGPAHCPNMTDVDYRTEFSFWTLASSNLILATDPRAFSPIMKEVLLNTELIDVNQQPGTRQGMGLVRIATGSCGGGGGPAPSLPCETWARPPGDDGAHYVLLFNPNDPSSPADPASGPNATLSVSWAALGLPAGSSAAVRDLWAHADLGSFTGGYTGAAILPHEARTLKVTPA